MILQDQDIETRFLVQHELCNGKCGLNESVCKSKQKWNHDECRCECKELDDWGSCKTDYMWNARTCDYERNKTCKVDKYLNIKIVHPKNVSLVN